MRQSCSAWVATRVVAIAVLESFGIASRVCAQQQGSSPPLGPGFSQYVRMPDDIDLAITVLIAAPGNRGSKAPTIAEFTRYGRLTVETSATLDAWRRAGFNCALVDTRGSGAS